MAKPNQRATFHLQEMSEDGFINARMLFLDTEHWDGWVLVLYSYVLGNYSAWTLGHFFIIIIIKISKLVLPGVMLKYERTSNDRKKERKHAVAALTVAVIT